MTKYRYDLYDFGCVPASATYPAAPTDNTAAIQTALTVGSGVPAGGTLEIPPDFLFSPTGQFVGGFGFSNTLTRSAPIEIVGQGFCSNLKPLPSFPTTAPNLLFQQGGTYWFNSTLHNFAIGDDPTAVPYHRNGGKGIWFSSTGGMSEVFVEKVRVGESGNDHSIVIDGIGTQHCRVLSSKVWGGLHVIQTADNHTIDDNDFAGLSTFGVLVDMPGAYGAKFGRNVVTCVGGAVFQSGSLIAIRENTFEETPGHPTNNSWLTGQNGQLVLCGCPNGPVNDARVIDNSFVTFSGSSASNIVTNPGNKGTARTHIRGNILAASGGVASVINYDTALIAGPNTWLTPIKYLGSLPALTYGGG
jgi:hypothetical protein